MLTVHGFWSVERGLCLWAEDSDRRVKSPSDALRAARPHPFAASTDQLAELHDGKPDSAILLLPSVRTAPLDSPELVRVRQRPQPTTEPILLAWTVPVVTFGPASAAGALTQPAEHVRHGASMRYLAELSAFARDLADRGQVLPDLAQDTHGHLARWRPVLQGSDIVTTQSLVTAMPPVCRAETDTPANLAGQNPAELVDAAVHALVDAEVRSRLAGRRPLRPGGRLTLDDQGAAGPIPATELWLDALVAADGRLRAEGAGITQLQQALLPWSTFGLGQTGPARATFRLSEAGDDPDDTSGWRLEFLLQSVADPSLLVPAEQVWAGGDGLRRWLDRPDELLLGELGRASTMYPPIGEALRQPRPVGLDLDAEGAYAFLSSAAALLDQAGFGVQLPSWWSQGRRVIGLRGKSTTRQQGVVAGSAFSRESLVQFDWQLAIGDEPLTEEELAALAAAKAPLVRLRGEWVAVDPAQVRRGLDFLARRRDSDPKTAADVIALANAHPDDLDTPLPVMSIEADGWLGDLLAGTAERALRPVPAPAGFTATLRPYQQRGLSWLAFLADLRLGACLADDMGLGKTVQLLALEAHERAERPGTRPTLLLCPMSLVGNWQREAAAFAPNLWVHAHHGPGRLRGDTLAAKLARTDILVTTYQTASRDIDELELHAWARVVLDEAQAVKNSLSQAARAVRRLHADHRVALTGTPVENRLAELWSIMDFVNPGMLGTSEAFRKRYAIPIERHAMPEPAQRLRVVTRPYVLRRVKTDPAIIDDLPDKIEIKQYCQLTTEQASLYKSVVDDMMSKIENTEGIERRGNVLATMTKLKQVCNHPAQLLHDRSEVGRRSGKIIRLEEIVEEILAEGDRALLFTQFTEFAELLLPHLAARFDSEVLYLHGGTSKKRRDQMVERFQSGDGPPLFLLSLKAGGTGLNLTAANQVIHLDRWWNPAVENQATDRAFRIGQRRNVQVRKFICLGTLEEKIDQIIEDKQALADLVISDGERWLTELSTDALRDLFTLSEGAVVE